MARRYRRKKKLMTNQQSVMRWARRFLAEHSGNLEPARIVALAYLQGASDTVNDSLAESEEVARR